MKLKEFDQIAHKVVDWMSSYLNNVEHFPVKSKVAPGDILRQLPAKAPETGEAFDRIMQDINNIIMPGVTHWQHPMFFAYFPANASPPSILAEMITATLGLQCMLWETSPAATELEQRVMVWLRDMLGLPSDMHGVIQDTASVSTLCAILNAREKASNYHSNETGMSAATCFTIYVSAETHSSVEKAVRIAGVGSKNLRKIAVNEDHEMRPDLLEQAIQEDIARGKKPAAIVATLGTTGSASIDPLREIGEIAKRHNIWLHVDAAFAGSALILPEKRWMIDGIEYVDSIVMNPHKWLMVNFDCSALFVRDLDGLRKTFEIHPEYLKTAQGEQVQDFRNFGIQLGRRFRALKLWLVIRSYGIAGLQSIIRNHLALAKELHEQLQCHADFEVMAPCQLSLVCFRYRPCEAQNDADLNEINQLLLSNLNASGTLYLTHTKLNGKYTLRLAIGQTYTRHEHVHKAYETIIKTARSMSLE